ncbi:Putative neutral zinc metallopeptidase [Aquisphaera giovannonii]|uniref:Neutral zinc metallopeptidase n=1 Tax=Aquisphaera giovannonii TaxID=406548 RepID=A0A5B9VX34_9BACT|nr:zinc metallopeptidase [Aquisphaera giovannonii]QEH32507.1 Putative neutral zinc metallopeptidase [Aquisphaera giovannonii]
MVFDPLYMLMMLPGMLIAGWAQAKIASAYREGSRYRASSGATGAQAAAAIMRAEGIENVPIEPVAGQLTDHYDPSKKVLRLSETNYEYNTLAAVGVAAHEAGHALQDAHHYPLMTVRNLIVPLASFGSNFAIMALVVGMMARSMWFIWLGIILFSTTVVFQLVNLPVEFDASRRARKELQRTGLISPEEDRVVGKVLNAAAMTYVAATLTSIFQLLYFFLRARGSSSGRRDDYV